MPLGTSQKFHIVPFHVNQEFRLCEKLAFPAVPVKFVILKNKSCDTRYYLFLHHCTNINSTFLALCISPDSHFF